MNNGVKKIVARWQTLIINKFQCHVVEGGLKANKLLSLSCYLSNMHFVFVVETAG